EGGAVELYRQQIAAVDGDAAGRGEGPGVEGGSRPVLAQGENSGRAAGTLVVASWLQRGQVRIPLDVAIGHHDRDEVVAVGADQASAPVVEGVAVLPHARDRLVSVVDRVEAEIHAAEVDRPGAGLAVADDLTTAQPVGDVDPVVDTEDRMADAELRVLGREPL